MNTRNDITATLTRADSLSLFDQVLMIGANGRTVEVVTVVKLSSVGMDDVQIETIGEDGHRRMMETSCGNTLNVVTVTDA